MKITYELDDAKDSPAEILMMAHASEYIGALSDIDELIRSKLKHGDIYAYLDEEVNGYGEKLVDTVDNLRKKNDELIHLLEEIRRQIGEVIQDYI